MIWKKVRVAAAAATGAVALLAITACAPGGGAAGPVEATSVSDDVAAAGDVAVPARAFSAAFGSGAIQKRKGAASIQTKRPRATKVSLQSKPAIM